MKHIFTTIILLALTGTAAQAQFRDVYPDAPYESDVISARPIRYFLGLPLGVLLFQHNGAFSPSCPCVFQEAGNMELFKGLEFSVQFPKRNIAFKVLVSYQDFSSDFTYDTTRMSTVVGEAKDTLLQFRATSHVVLRYLSVQPSIAYYIPYSQLFIQAGIDIGYPIKYTYTHQESILTVGNYTYDNGSRVNVIANERTIPDGNRLRFGLSFGLGGDIFLTPYVYLTPQAGLTIPLTNVSETLARDHWKVMSEYALLIVKFRL